MANYKYRLLNGGNKQTFVTFNEQGYIINAKGFGSIIWWYRKKNIDEDLIGKHVDELAEIFKKYGVRPEYYYNFEVYNL